MLGFETTAKTNVHSVIREAIQWGVLSPALKKDGKIWPGHYVVNWLAVEVVANLIPMNPGDRPLNSRYLHHDKRQWGEFRQANELIQEFWAFVRATRVQALVLSHSVLPADNVLSPSPDSTTTKWQAPVHSPRACWQAGLGPGPRPWQYLPCAHRY